MSPRTTTWREGWGAWASMAAAALFVVAASGCRRPGRTGPAPKAGSTTEVILEGEPPSFPGDFAPAPPLPAPAAGDPAAPGAGYLALIEPRVQPRWRGFLEDCRLRLPPADALNDPSLVARLRLFIDKHGVLTRVATLASSGNADFDGAAAEIATDAGPLPPPPRSVISDDELTYVDWTFARDQRQAGAASAQLHKVEWPIGRAVTKLLADGNVTEAALRLARHARAAGDLAAAAPELRAEVLALAERVMGAAVREALLSEDPSVQRAAVAAAARSRAPGVARELRGIADGSLDLSLRGEAIAALGAIGDQAAAPLLTEIIRRDQGGNAEVSAQAAAVLGAFGSIDLIAPIVAAWLDDKAPDKQFAALVVTSKAEIPSLTKTLVDRFRSVRDRSMRARLCTALGPAAATTIALKALLDGVKDGDATVRAACAQSIARAAVGGVRARAAYWAMADTMKDKDERVRAAAVTASIHLNPGRFSAELYRFSREQSELVLAALAEGLGMVPGGDALSRLTSLTGHGSAEVRVAAARGLARQRNEAARSAAVALSADPDPRVRLAVVAAIDSDTALVALAADESSEVRVAAGARAVALRGRLASLIDLAEAIAEAPPRTAARAQHAAAWLDAK